MDRLELGQDCDVLFDYHGDDVNNPANAQKGSCQDPQNSGYYPSPQYAVDAHYPPENRDYCYNQLDYPTQLVN